jgi:hypothetical protein
MKTRILALMVILFAGTTFGQAFQKTIYNPDLDFNHYSIENTANGYVCVGTLFGAINNDIHIISLNHDGDILWEKTIDRTEDDRGLDVVVDEQNNIILTGYTSPTGVGFPNLYIAKMDLNGNYIVDRGLVTISPSLGFDLMSAGTNIIYSKKMEAYVVGGMTTRKMEKPLTDNYAILVSFDLNLNIIEQKRIHTGSKFQSINDIVEVPDGFFITGGIHLGGQNQGVLAATVDHDLNITKNFSFDDNKGGKHNGASIVYDKTSDDIYIMSNNAYYRNPQLTRINNISNNLPYCSTSISANSFIMLLDDKGNYDPAGYKLETCAWNDQHLIASGYFLKKPGPNGTAGTMAWIVELDKATGARVSSMEWYIPAPNGSPKQGGILSDYSYGTPTYYTPEIMTIRNDFEGYVMIAPRLIDKKYSLELMTTDYIQESACFKNIDYESKEIAIRHFCNNESGIIFQEEQQYLYPENTRNEYDIFCENGNLARSATALKMDEVDAEITLSVYPNPANKSLTIQLPNAMINGTIEVLDLTGKVVLQSNVYATNTELKIEILENGIYFIRLSATNSKTYKGKFIKNN